MLGTLAPTERAVFGLREVFDLGPLLEGPVIVCLEMADGQWRAGLKGIQPRTVPVPAATDPAQHIAAPSKDSGPRKASRRGWRDRG
ncbi:hypothetical protein ACWC24_38055 [Streptomyces sp. NPDC001443]